MRILELVYNEEDKSITCVFPYSRRFVEFLSCKLPKTQRIFNPVFRTWTIKPKSLTKVAKYGMYCFDQLDLSRLPEHWRQKIESKKPFQINELTTDVNGNLDNPYAVLFLKSNAPLWIVKVVYKALAAKNHPDHGGDVDKFILLKKAYDAILEKVKNHA